jgi:hypothetical protein
MVHKRSFVTAAVLLVLLAVASLVPGCSGEEVERAAEKNKFTRKEIGEFFRDYPDVLKLLYKAMNRRRKAQGKTPRCCIGFEVDEDCNMCLSLGDTEECSDICQ